MAKGPKGKAPKPSTKGGGAKGKGGSKKGGGGKSLAAAAALNALFGGGGLGAGVKGSKGGGRGGSGGGGGGEADYKPFPSYTKPTAQVRKYANPTLTTISTQISLVTRSLQVQEKLLAQQFQDIQHGYREMARATRESNAESGARAIAGSGALPMDAIKSMTESFTAFDLALKEATAQLKDLQTGGGGGMPLGIPDKATGARKPPPKEFKFVKKADALDADGNLKKGFEAVRDKNGKIRGYRKSLNFFQKQKFKIKSDVKALKTAGVKAFRKNIRNPFMKFYRTQKRRMTKAFTKAKDAAMAKLGEWGSAAKNALSKLGGKAGSVLKKMLQDPRISKVLEALKKAGGAVNAMTLGRVALYIWAVWTPLKACYDTFKNADKMSDEEFKQQMSQNVADLVSEAGVLVATELVSAFVLSTIGSVVPGIGNVVGFILGLIVGMGAYAIISFIYGKAAEEAVENVVRKLVGLIIDAYYKLRGTKKQSTSKSSATPKTPKSTPPAGSTKISGSGTVPRMGGMASNLGTIKNLTVADLITDAAEKAGVDPAALLAIASESAGFDPRKKADQVTGKELFPLTQEQWKQITAKYGSDFPQLKAGINDPRAASIASALLMKDAQDFLTANGLPNSAPALYASWLFGPDGAYKLLTAQPEDVASVLLPGAAGKRPQLFKNSAGEDVTAQELVKTLYNTTVTAKRSAANKAAKKTGSPSENQSSTSAAPPSASNTSSAAPGTASDSPAAESAPSTSSPGAVASPAAASTPSPPAAAKAATNTTPTASEKATPGAVPGAAAPGAVATAASPATPGAAKTPSTARPEGEGSEAAPVDNAKAKRIEEKGQKQAALDGASAIPTPGLSPTKDIAAKVAQASKEIEKELTNPTSQVNTTPNKAASPRTPVILPSNMAGRAGTGLVLNPYYNPGDIAKSIYYSPIKYPADAAGSA